MSRLRVRSGADIHLADAFDLDGCPLCRERRRTEANYLESILAESVNDVGFRTGLDAARGFCGRHARAILDADRARSGSLGASILLRASLVARLPEIEATASAKGRGRARRAADARRPPACPACDRLARSGAGTVGSVVRLTEDPAWAEAVASAPICLDHLLALMDRRDVPAWWPPIEERHVERLRRLRDRLEGYAHDSSHDRRHLQTDDQRASVDEAADLLAGGLARASAPVAGIVPEPAAPTGVGPGKVPDDAAAVLITGVYGSGKSTLAVELADLLDEADVPVAAMDLDWLGWYSAPVDWDEHEDPRFVIRHVEALSTTYLEAGVRRIILAGSLPTTAIDRLRDAVRVPMRIVRLEVSAIAIERRLQGDPNRSRADDMARALEALERGQPPDPAEVVVDGDRPVAEVAKDVLSALGWFPD